MPRNILRIVTFAALWIANAMLVISVFSSSMALGVLGIMLGIFVGMPALMAWFSIDREAFRSFSQYFKGLAGMAERGRAMLNGQSTSSADLHIPNPVLEEDDDIIEINVRLSSKDEKESQPAEKSSRKSEFVVNQYSNELYSVPITVESELQRDLPAVDTDDFEHLKQDETEAQELESQQPKEPSEWEKEKEQDAEYKRLREAIETLDESQYEDLLQYTDHADSRVRLAVIQRLRHLDREQSFEHLQNALDDQDAIVQRAARIALNEIEDSQ